MLCFYRCSSDHVIYYRIQILSCGIYFILCLLDTKPIPSYTGSLYYLLCLKYSYLKYPENAIIKFIMCSAKNNLGPRTQKYFMLTTKNALYKAKLKNTTVLSE